jgi:hypothetical protein
VQADPKTMAYSVKVTRKRSGHRGGAQRREGRRSRKPIPSIAFFTKQLKIVLANSGVVDPERIESYIAAGGYQALHQALPR